MLSSNTINQSCLRKLLNCKAHRLNELLWILKFFLSNFNSCFYSIYFPASSDDSTKTKAISINLILLFISKTFKYTYYFGDQNDHIPAELVKSQSHESNL
ncbi:hypothetical protein BpHYR1_044517 [Brachionus plicatilis]|uniref:Uncharacterized protein n=1 Tax=Brachionus plicatilis TaxID=10195 RepID=A0A3M7SYZ6_BRAPC|nr:hypothetical protein BpHYR1_044517 [Brachionus plicatilis]